MSEIGLFGGSFDPVHCGHLQMAASVRMALELDHIEFLLTADPPHKSSRNQLPFSMRWHLLRHALLEEPFCHINEVEIFLPGPSYTFDTIRFLRGTRPNDRFHFILGAEDFVELGSWYNGMNLVEHMSFALMPRAATGEEQVRQFIAASWPQAVEVESGHWQFPSQYGGKEDVRFVHTPCLRLSSTDVRQRFLDGKSLDGLVPPHVVARLNNIHDLVLSHWFNANVI